MRIPAGGAQCDDRGTVRQINLHDGWNTTLYCATYMGSKIKPAGLAALAALRDQVAAGPPPTKWLVATDPRGMPAGWLAVTRYRQRFGAPSADVALPLPGVTLELAVLEQDGAISVELVKLVLMVRGQDARVTEEGRASVHVDGAPMVALAETRELARELTILGDRGMYVLRLVGEQPTTPAKPAPPDQPGRRRRESVKDMILRGKRRDITGDVQLGWLEIGQGGVLSCAGTVRCAGAVIEDGGVLRCKSLVTNFLHVDGATIETEAIHARVVDHVQRALDHAIARGIVTAELINHFGGELNPSWDTTRGDNPLRPELYDARDDFVRFDFAAIRRALAAGDNIFVVGELLVR